MINKSEDVNKIQTAISNVLIDMNGRISGNSFIANSNNYESLTKIYETMKNRYRVSILFGFVGYLILSLSIR